VFFQIVNFKEVDFLYISDRCTGSNVLSTDKERQVFKIIITKIDNKSRFNI
jgi:hypothetical protein